MAQKETKRGRVKSCGCEVTFEEGWPFKSEQNQTLTRFYFVRTVDGRVCPLGHHSFVYTLQQTFALVTEPEQPIGLTA